MEAFTTQSMKFQTVHQQRAPLQNSPVSQVASPKPFSQKHRNSFSEMSVHAPPFLHGFNAQPMSKQKTRRQHKYKTFQLISPDIAQQWMKEYRV